MDVRKVRAFDNLSYLIAHEAMRKNDASRQNMKILANNMEQRARIEMSYTKMLKEWVQEIGRDEKGKEILYDRLWTFITSTLKRAATKQAQNHEEVYNLIMDKDGPCYVMENGSDASASNEDVLNKLKDKYIELGRRRRSLEDDMRRRCSNEIHCQKLIKDLEKKLAHTSRITSAKKSSRGIKKVDMMRDRLTLLREQTELDTEKIDDLHKEMDAFQKESQKELEKLTQDFGECEKWRVRFVAQQSRQFEKHLWQISGAASKKNTSDLEENTIDKLLMQGWAQDIIMKAKARKAGQVETIEELLKSMDKSAMNASPSSKASSSATSGSKRHVHVFPRFKAHKEGDDDMSVLSVTCNFSEDSNLSAKTNPSSSSYSDHLETILVPDDNGARSRQKGRPFPTREFCPAYSTDEDEDVPRQVRDFTMVDDIDWKTGRLVNALDLGLLRGIQVQAIEDYKAVHQSQISFKKGQIIKQKAGADEDGFCYGWTRERRMSAKVYGRYPKQAVIIYRPDTPAPFLT